MNPCGKCGSTDKTSDGRCLPCRRENYRRVDWKRKGILFRGKPIAYADYEEQLKRQGGRCATCRVPLREGVLRRPDSAHLDHDHVTMEFRGVLCLVCNKTLRVEVTVEALERMIAYLNNPPAQQLRYYCHDCEHFSSTCGDGGLCANCGSDSLFIYKDPNMPRLAAHGGP